MRATEIALQILLGIPAFLVPHDHALDPTQRRQPTRHGVVITQMPVAMQLDKVGEQLVDVIQRVGTLRMPGDFGDLPRGEIAVDIEDQLAWLFREDFAWRAGFAGMCDYPRRLRAIRSRLGRVSSLPIVKDLEKLQRMRRLWTPWFNRWTEHPNDPRLWAIGWALEEYRISIFAPDIRVIGKVSEKRIEQMISRDR